MAAAVSRGMGMGDRVALGVVGGRFWAIVDFLGLISKPARGREGAKRRLTRFGGVGPKKASSRTSVLTPFFSFDRLTW